MLSIYKINNISNGPSIKTIFVGDFLVRIFSGLVFFSYFQYLFCSYFSFEPGINSFAFNYSVFNVVRICSSKEMLWIHAFSIVAMVTNQKSFRYWSFKKDIGDSVRSPNFIIKTKPTVTRVVKLSSPNDALAFFFCLTKESFFMTVHKLLIPKKIENESGLLQWA